MRTSIMIGIAALLSFAGVALTTVTGHAGDFETCREVQSSNLRNFNRCLDRYNLPRVTNREFRQIVGDNDFYDGWQQRPRYSNRPWRQQRRYVESYDFVPNHDGVGVIITFGQFTVMFK